jgi:cytochrome P450
LISRRLIETDEIGGYHIPKNSEIYISPYLIHRHPTFWDNAEHFDPERFSTDNSARRPHFAYLPFSSGPHVCIGNSFSLVVVQSVVAYLAQIYKLDLISKNPIQPQAHILLQPNCNIMMKIAKG